MYAELQPHQDLRSLVECYWTSRLAPKDSPASYRVLPDGCADLIFDLTPGREYAYWVGTMTTSLVVERSDSTHLFGIRFNPGGARELLGLPLEAITDARLTIDEVTPSAKSILEFLVSKKSAEPQIELWLKNSCLKNKNFPLVQKISEIVKRSPGEVRVSDVSDSLGLSRQYLNRVMKENVGIDLKTFQRVLRMRALTDGLRGRTIDQVDWSSVALEHGFYDQSHFINDFRELVGIPPTEYFA